MRGKKIGLKRIDLAKLLQILDNLIEDRKNKRRRPPLYRESLVYFAVSIKLNFILKDEKISDFTLSVQIIAKVGKIDKLIVGGTDFGYNDTYNLSWKKEVKSHIKTKVLVATKGGITFPLAVEVGRALSIRGKSYIIGGRLYGKDNQ